MTDIEKYQRAVIIANRAKEKLIKALKESLARIPDNPNIQRGNSSINSFTVSTKSLSSESWHPKYYDNKKIIQAMCNHIRDTQTIEAIKKYLDEVITTRKVDGYLINPHCHDEIKKVVKDMGF